MKRGKKGIDSICLTACSFFFRGFSSKNGKYFFPSSDTSEERCFKGKKMVYMSWTLSASVHVRARNALQVVARTATVVAPVGLLAETRAALDVRLALCLRQPRTILTQVLLRASVGIRLVVVARSTAGPVPEAFLVVTHRGVDLVVGIALRLRLLARTLVICDQVGTVQLGQTRVLH